MHNILTAKERYKIAYSFARTSKQDRRDVFLSKCSRLWNVDSAAAKIAWKSLELSADFDPIGMYYRFRIAGVFITAIDLENYRASLQYVNNHNRKWLASVQQKLDEAELFFSRYQK